MLKILQLTVYLSLLFFWKPWFASCNILSRLYRSSSFRRHCRRGDIFFTSKSSFDFVYGKWAFVNLQLNPKGQCWVMLFGHCLNWCNSNCVNFFSFIFQVEPDCFRKFWVLLFASLSLQQQAKELMQSIMELLSYGVLFETVRRRL